MNSYTLADIPLGLSQSFDVVVTDSMMDQFGSITADVNPLHLDSAFAREMGFSDRVVYGMLTASFYSTLVGVYLPGRYALFHGIDAGFNAAVFVGDRLTVYGSVAYISEAIGRIEIKANITNQHARKVSGARIKVGFNGP